MEVNFSDTNLVTEILCMQPPSLLVLTQSGISINLSSGEVTIPENLELSAASREIWNGISKIKGCRTIHEAFCEYDNMEGCALAANERIAALESTLQVAREFINYAPCLCIGGEFPVECKRCTTLARIGEVSRG